jgi:hypothetical protein
VGATAASDGTHGTTLAEHWTGRRWVHTRTPAVPDGGYLYSVAARARQEVWAVGSAGDLPLVERWNGAGWHRVAAPAPRGALSTSLYGISVLGPGDVWAGGTFVDRNGLFHPLTEHWNGTRWTVVAAHEPAGSTHAQFWDIAAVAHGDVWASGFVNDNHGVTHTLVEHWNGTAWRQVPSPDARTAAGGFSETYDLAAVSAHDVWLVGNSFDGTATNNSLVEHWNGRRWRIVPSPSPAGNGGYSMLIDVSAVAKGDVTAVGLQGVGANSSPLVEHWTGRAWVVQQAH